MEGLRTVITALVQDLRRPDAYPWRPECVELIETHISWVLLAGDRVVKVKRPVRLDFVDQSTPARRRAICEDEVRLNARLTDGVYLGVVPITRSSRGFEVDGDGEPVEWATLMRRLPAERMLDALIFGDEVPADLADRLADRLIPFHQEVARPCPGAFEQQATDATRVVIDNLDELRPLMQGRPFAVELGLIDAAVREFVASQDDLLLRRARAGWIREGHGDLRAEHICLDPDGAVQVFDCVEFSLDIRCADVASDLAFLLMDLDRLGIDAVVGERLVARYREAGLALPGELLGLYEVHRALVRAKVDAIRMAESDEDDDTAMLGDIAGYLHTAARRAIGCAPVAIAMTGLSGTGKSTVAGQLARVLGADWHRSDVVRKELAGVEGAAADAWGAGIYAQDVTGTTYERLIALGRASIDAGKPAILDGTFLDEGWRDAVAAMAREVGVPFLLVETVTDEAVLERRLEDRSRRGADPSDADVGVMRKQRAALADAPIAIPRGTLAVTIDTTPAGHVDLDPVLVALRAAGIVTGRITGLA
jgi:aminoglycoside phosphotransferase family enzyme/predicted kinase